MGIDPVGYTSKNDVMSFNRYLYANNNPYKYVDPNGEFIFTAIAIASFAYSAYDGYQSGGASGAITEASGFNDAVASYNSIKNGDVSGAAWSILGIACKSCKAVKKVSKKINSKETGSYTNIHESGKKYHGKGGRKRSQKSGRREARRNEDPHVATDWTPAKNNRDAFKQESRRLDADGGPKSSTNYNRAQSPGKKFRKQDGGN